MACSLTLFSVSAWWKEYGMGRAKQQNAVAAINRKGRKQPNNSWNSDNLHVKKDKATEQERERERAKRERLKTRGQEIQMHKTHAGMA